MLLHEVVMNGLAPLSTRAPPHPWGDRLAFHLLLHSTPSVSANGLALRTIPGVRGVPRVPRPGHTGTDRTSRLQPPGHTGATVSGGPSG